MLLRSTSSWSLVSLCLFAAGLFTAYGAGGETKLRSLYELSANSKVEGIEPFLGGNMEPFGAVCVAYVKENSPNHKLMQKLGAATPETDEALYDLQLPMAAAIDWEEEELLMIVKRKYGAKLWNILRMEPLDEEPTLFPSKGSKAWKEKKVRQWMLDNAFPTLNFRIPNSQGKMLTFPYTKYFGPANSKGVGLIVLDLQPDSDIAQFKVAKTLRQYVDKYSDKFRFAFLEKDDEKTLELRQFTKIGLDRNFESELILIEEPRIAFGKPEGDNNFHGSPKKYRLTNITEAPTRQFFDDYAKGKLPTYWLSNEVANASRKEHATRMTASTFEETVFDAPKKTPVLVSFFNDKPDDSCTMCETSRVAWESLAKEAALEKQLRKFRIAHIDQSANEHPETLVAQRLAQPMIVFYPPGTAKDRRRKRRILYDMSQTFTTEALLQKLRDLAEELEEEGEL